MSTTPEGTVQGTPARTAALGAAAGTALALLGDAPIYGVGNLGAPIRVITGWAPDGTPLSIGEVVVTVVVSVALGAVFLWALQRLGQRRGRDLAPFWAVAALAVTVLSSVPLWRLDVDAGSKVSLTALHLWTGLACVAGQALVRRPARSADHLSAALS